MQLYYSKNLNPRVAVAMARYLDAPVEFIGSAHVYNGGQDWYRELNPMGRFPLLIEDDGTALPETDAIVCRLSALAGSDLWRRNDEQAEMIRWISWGTHHLTRAADPVYFDRVVMPSFTEDRLPAFLVEEGLAEWAEYLRILDGALADRDWLVGDHVSYADFRVATAFPFAGAAGLPIEDVPNVSRWSARLDEIDTWRDPFNGLE